MMPWILIAILALIILLGVVAIIVSRKEKMRPDYYSFFVMGIIWVAFGVFAIFIHGFSLSGLFLIGLVFAIIGLANKDKWKKNRRSWTMLDKKERKIMAIMIALLVFLLIIGVAFLFFFNI